MVVVYIPFVSKPNDSSNIAAFLLGGVSRVLSGGKTALVASRWLKVDRAACPTCLVRSKGHAFLLDSVEIPFASGKGSKIRTSF